MSTRILVIGNGGREHALAWKLRQGRGVEQVFVAPGNPGTAAEPGICNVAINATDIQALVAFATDAKVDLTVVGPEAPLSLGVVDAFMAAGLPIFGPTQAAAQLESSKAFTKAFLAEHGIPTAAYAVHTQLQPALDYVRQQGAPIVIKADGLAAGKGVVVAMTLAEAEAALHDMLGNRSFGAAGAQVVIEAFMRGEEASYIVIAHGLDYQPLSSAQDHKRVGEGDTGPNTGGMGAYSPAPVVTPLVEERIRRRIIEPTLAGMAQRGTPFTGFLYAGVMIDAQGNPHTVEFNARLGDPETQPLLLRLRSDMPAVLQAALQGRLIEQALDWDPRAALAVVLAAHGYPAAPRSGDRIVGLDTPELPGSKVFQAGTRLDANGAVCSAGGRVLTVCALGARLEDARTTAYARLDQLQMEGGFCRRDIGWRALQRSA
jgi:phosphoribosylamine--glycine ligase